MHTRYAVNFTPARLLLLACLPLLLQFAWAASLSLEFAVIFTVITCVSAGSLAAGSLVVYGFILTLRQCLGNPMPLGRYGLKAFAAMMSVVNLLATAINFIELPLAGFALCYWAWALGPVIAAVLLPPTAIILILDRLTKALRSKQAS